MKLDSEMLIQEIKKHEENTRTGNSPASQGYSLAHKHIIELIEALALLEEAKNDT